MEREKRTMEVRSEDRGIGIKSAYRRSRSAPLNFIYQLSGGAGYYFAFIEGVRWRLGLKLCLDSRGKIGRVVV